MQSPAHRRRIYRLVSRRHLCTSRIHYDSTSSPTVIRPSRLYATRLRLVYKYGDARVFPVAPEQRLYPTFYTADEKKKKARAHVHASRDAEEARR